MNNLTYGATKTDTEAPLFPGLESAVDEIKADKSPADPLELPVNVIVYVC